MSTETPEMNEPTAPTSPEVPVTPEAPASNGGSLLGQQSEPTNGDQGGERPEWLPEKFQSPQAMAESYAELEKKLGSVNQAPESYDISDDRYEGFEFNRDEDLTGFMELAKQNGIPQEGFEQMLDFYVESEMSRGAQDVQTRTDIAIETFGGQEGFNKAVSDLKTMAKAQLDSDQQKLLHIATSASQKSGAAAIQLLSSILSNREPTQLGSRTVVNNTGPSKEEIMERMKDPRYKTDPAFNASVFADLKKANGE